MRNLTKSIGKWSKNLKVLASDGYTGIVNFEYYCGEDYVRTTVNNRWKKVQYSIADSQPYFVENGKRKYLRNFIKNF